MDDVAEKRMWGIVLTLVFALGGWWLQNQNNEVQRIDSKLALWMQHSDSRYVLKEYLEVINKEQLRRLERIEEKLDTIMHKKDDDYVPPKLRRG